MIGELAVDSRSRVDRWQQKRQHPSRRQPSTLNRQPQMIVIEQLRKNFASVQALQDVSFTAADGRITGLLGHNGAGKSTTLRILSTVLRADAGRALVDGHDCASEPLQVRRSLGVLPHASGLYVHLTGRENIEYYARLHGMKGKALADACDSMIERLGIGAVAERRAKGYSQGERLKVALARALIHRPRTVILDEPTNGLDVNAVRMLRELIRELKASGCCVLFSSHVMQEVAALCDDIVIISHGQVVVRGYARRNSHSAWHNRSRRSIRARCCRRGVVVSAVGTVFVKEVLENLRDRRVVFSAFFFGVLLAPVIFGLTTTLVSKRAVRDQEQPLQLPVIGAAQAPNLMRFLAEHGTEIEPVMLAPQVAIGKVRAGDYDLILIVPPQYATQLRAGNPAPLDLVLDTANTRASGKTERARRLLDAYSHQVAALRLLARGVSPAVVEPLDVRSVDVATPAGRSLMVLGMMTYFCLMSMLVGGFYLAIDTTAGERERGSLEPLLSLPATRAQLIIGKILATCAFMAASLLLTLAAFATVLAFVPLEALGMSANFGPSVVLAIFSVMVVFVPLGAGLMTVVASFTRSNREAQTWLSLVLMIPLAPIMFAVVNGTRPTAALMAIPSLSQHLLATDLMRGDGVDPLHVMVSVITTLIAGLLLIWLATRLYRRESLLG